jgi:hypothetical protein
MTKPPRPPLDPRLYSESVCTKNFRAAFPTSGEVVPSMGIEDLTVEHMANWLECMGTRLGTMVWLIRWPASWRPSRLGRAKFHWDAGVVEIVDRN